MSIYRLSCFVTALAIMGCSPTHTDKVNTDSNQTIAAKGMTMPTTSPFTPTNDLWLEEVQGEQALSQVNQWNANTLNKLTIDPRFSQYEQAALDIVNAQDKIAYGNYRGGYVYNFWQDETHVRGVIRRTTLDSYMSNDVQWDELLSIDALAKSEKKNWVYKGSTCLATNYDRCMIRLSDGGKDAVEVREWDHGTKSFVENGLFIPEAKNTFMWQDANTLIVGTDWDDNALTESGYARVLKTVKRGQTLDQAQHVFSANKTDILAAAYQLEVNKNQFITLIHQSETFYHNSTFWLRDDGSTVPLPLPKQSSITGVFKQQLLVSLQEDWVVDGQTYAQGQLVSFDFGQWLTDQRIRNLQIVYAPTNSTSIDSVSITQSKVLVNVLEHVVNKIYAFDIVQTTQAQWQAEQLDLPTNSALRISSANDKTDIVFINSEGFTTPDSLYKLNVLGGNAEIIKSIPSRFNDADFVVKQRFTTSKDGTQVPYFVVAHKNTQLDGNNPTLLYGYGGFEISLTPSYSGVRGKLWLENGGVYVLANIRGGGEYGPAWHQAGLKTKRQVIYDDFIAVAEDLIATRYTTPNKLGIMGGSNGGLLMGVMYTQRPDLFNAVVCQVPLLDMLRYHKLLAGASWVGEYGSPEIPEERAFLESISPLHNIQADTQYPSIFFVTSTKDDRVHPAHARKMANALAQMGYSFEYYENIDGGHSASANLAESAKRAALEYVYLAQQLMD